MRLIDQPAWLLKLGLLFSTRLRCRHIQKQRKGGLVFISFILYINGYFDLIIHPGMLKSLVFCLFGSCQYLSVKFYLFGRMQMGSNAQEMILIATLQSKFICGCLFRCLKFLFWNTGNMDSQIYVANMMQNLQAHHRYKVNLVQE